MHSVRVSKDAIALLASRADPVVILFARCVLRPLDEALVVWVDGPGKGARDEL